MNRNERRALSRLPVSPYPWEVALIPAPPMADVDIRGEVVLVVERGSERPRFLAELRTGEPLLAALSRAFTQPLAPCAPARPSRLLCTDDALARRLAVELLDLRVAVEQVAELPLLEDAVQQLLTALEPAAAPGITSHAEAWADVLERLSGLAPWRDRQEDQTFRFEGEPALGELVGVLHGSSAVSPGLTFYSTRADRDRSLAALADSDAEALKRVKSFRLLLVPAADLGPDELANCRGAGLVTSSGWCPKLAVRFRGMSRVASEDEQALLLLAMDAVVRTLENAAAPDNVVALRGAARARSSGVKLVFEAESPSAPALASPSPSSSPPALITGDHGVAITQMKRVDSEALRHALVLKLSARDAEPLVRALDRVDALRFEPGKDGYLVHAMVGSLDLGPLGPRWAIPELATLAALDRVLLVVSKGGTRSARARMEDVLFLEEVAVLGPEAAVRTSRHDPVFDRPTAAWPKGSATLAEFAVPVLKGMQATTEGPYRAALKLAVTVWNAVVLADFGGKPGPLADLRRSAGSEAGPAALVDGLIANKRDRYGGDPRLFVIDRIDWDDEEPNLRVLSKIPEGYAVGGVTG